MAMKMAERRVEEQSKLAYATDHSKEKNQKAHTLFDESQNKTKVAGEQENSAKHDEEASKERLRKEGQATRQKLSQQCDELELKQREASQNELATKSKLEQAEATSTKKGLDVLAVMRNNAQADQQDQPQDQVNIKEQQEKADAVTFEFSAKQQAAQITERKTKHLVENTKEVFWKEVDVAQQESAQKADELQRKQQEQRGKERTWKESEPAAEVAGKHLPKNLAVGAKEQRKKLAAGAAEREMKNADIASKEFDTKHKEESAKKQQRLEAVDFRHEALRELTKLNQDQEDHIEKEVTAKGQEQIAETKLKRVAARDAKWTRLEAHMKAKERTAKQTLKLRGKEERTAKHKQVSGALATTTVADLRESSAKRDEMEDNHKQQKHLRKEEGQKEKTQKAKRVAAERTIKTANAAAKERGAKRKESGMKTVHRTILAGVEEERGSKSREVDGKRQDLHMEEAQAKKQEQDAVHAVSEMDTKVAEFMKSIDGPKVNKTSLSTVSALKEQKHKLHVVITEKKRTSATAVSQERTMQQREVAAKGKEKKILDGDSDEGLHELNEINQKQQEQNQRVETAKAKLAQAQHIEKEVDAKVEEHSQQEETARLHEKSAKESLREHAAQESSTKGDAVREMNVEAETNKAAAAKTKAEAREQKLEHLAEEELQSKERGQKAHAHAVERRLKVEEASSVMDRVKGDLSKLSAELTAKANHQVSVEMDDGVPTRGKTTATEDKAMDDAFERLFPGSV